MNYHRDTDKYVQWNAWDFLIICLHNLLWYKNERTGCVYTDQVICKSQIHRATRGKKIIHSLNAKGLKSAITDSIAWSSERPVAVWRSHTGISNAARVFGRIDKAKVHGAWSFQIIKIEKWTIDYRHKPGAWCLKSTVNTEALRLELAFSKNVFWGLGDTGQLWAKEKNY